MPSKLCINTLHTLLPCLQSSIVEREDFITYLDLAEVKLMNKERKRIELEKSCKILGQMIKNGRKLLSAYPILVGTQ